MQISYKFKSKWTVRQIAGNQAFIGRPNAQQKVDVDLTPDTTVSRVHARIWLAVGSCWLEDLKSRFGTQVNGQKVTGAIRVQIGDSIQIGETTLRIDSLPDEASAAK
ncbi:MAG: FHA domain-containing protein [Pedosphaera sp.]|nr:FHA domain-containing protein [Pedosphaera sp.]MSU44152.1 FHA domain-containing protein [Pedosphaera sp.]